MTRELSIARRAGCAIAALALFAGRSDDADGDDARSSESPPEASTTATTAPAPPTSDAAAEPDPGERVVVLAEEFMLADVLSLGLRPVASTASVEQVGYQGLDEFDTTGIDVLPMTALSLERLEQLDLLDAPMIVLLQSDTVEGESAAVAEIQANPLWAQLPAVQAGNVVVMDRLGYPGATGQIEFLEDFTALFG